jgi:hypothetical protein
LNLTGESNSLVIAPGSLLHATMVEGGIWGAVGAWG